MVRLLGTRPVSSGLRMAWSESHELRLALGEIGGRAEWAGLAEPAKADQKTARVPEVT